MKAMILAAGKGERLRPITDEIPKPLLKVNGKTLIEYHIENLAASGVRDIVINVSHLADKITAALGNGQRYGVNLVYSHETEPLETGGGIFQALPLLGDEPFIVVSADIFTNYDFASLRQVDVLHAHVVLTDNPPFNPAGDFALIQQFVCPDATPKYNFAGISVLSPLLFAQCKPGKFSLAPLLFASAKRQQVTGEYFAGVWYNIGTKKLYDEIQEALSPKLSKTH